MSAIRPDERVLIYVLMRADKSTAMHALGGSHFEISRFDTPAKLIKALGKGGSVPVVVCDVDYLLSINTTWMELFESIAHLKHPPKLVVTKKDADERLWAEVLNLGAFDLFAWPPAREELVHVLTSAWLQWQRMLPPPIAPAKA